jgi:hypothetical protein
MISFKVISDWVFIIGTLSLLTFAGYKFGLHNGGIEMCNELGYVMMADGECISDFEYKSRLSMAEHSPLFADATTAIMGLDSLSRKNQSIGDVS